MLPISCGLYAAPSYKPSMIVNLRVTDDVDVEIRDLGVNAEPSLLRGKSLRSLRLPGASQIESNLEDVAQLSPDNSTLALAVRSAGRDVILMIDTRSCRVVKQTDAKGLRSFRWSPRSDSIAVLTHDPRSGSSDLTTLRMESPKISSTRIQGVAAFQWGERGVVLAEWKDGGRTMTLDQFRGGGKGGRPVFKLVRPDARPTSISPSQAVASLGLGDTVRPAGIWRDLVSLWDPISEYVKANSLARTALALTTGYKRGSGSTLWQDTYRLKNRTFAIEREQFSESGLVGYALLPDASVAYWSWGSLFGDDPSNLVDRPGLLVAKAFPPTHRKRWWLVQNVPQTECVIGWSKAP